MDGRFDGLVASQPPTYDVVAPEPRKWLCPGSLRTVLRFDAGVLQAYYTANVLYAGVLCAF